VVLEVDGTGKETGRNVYGTNLLMRKSGSDKLYYMYNGHADVTALIDASTGVVRGSFLWHDKKPVKLTRILAMSGGRLGQVINVEVFGGIL